MPAESALLSDPTIRPTEFGEAVLSDPRHHEAYRMKMRGMKVADIAEHFEVTERTIHRWFTAYVDEFRRSFENEPAANLIAENLAAIESMEQQALAEAADSVSRREKYGFLKTALQARQMRIDLMLKTGCLPKEPERLYSMVVEGKPHVDEKSETERPREEIEADLTRLLKFGRCL